MSENWANCTECSDLNARLVRGSVQLSLDCLFLVLQLITLPIFLRYPEFRQTISYRIMFAIGLCDVAMLAQDILGIFLISVFHTNYTTIKLLGAFGAPAFDMLYILQTLLAFNRFVIIVKSVKSPERVIDSSIWESYCFNGLFTCALLIYSFFVSFFVLGYVCVKYNDYYYYFFYDRLQPHTQIWTTIERNLQLSCTIIILTLYIAIVISIRIGKWKWAFMQSSLEFRILLQSSILYVMLAGATYAYIFWGWGIIAYFNSTNGLYVFNFFHNLFLSLLYGINPILNIAFNKRFRQVFLRSFKHRERVNHIQVRRFQIAAVSAQMPYLNL